MFTCTPHSPVVIYYTGMLRYQHLGIWHLRGQSHSSIYIQVLYPHKVGANMHLSSLILRPVSAMRLVELSRMHPLGNMDVYSYILGEAATYTVLIYCTQTDSEENMYCLISKVHGM